MRHEAEPETFVVDHDALGRTVYVAQRFGEKYFAIEALESGLDLKEQHPRVTQHRRGGLRLVLALAHQQVMRRGVVL